MNYEEYMVMECVWEQNMGADKDTKMESYRAPQVIRCFKYGKNIFIREGSSGTTVSAQSYVVTEQVKEKDKIDNQVIKSIYIVPDFDGTTPLIECLTWNS